MVTDGKQTYCSDHCVMYANIKSSCWTSETNIMLYVNYIPKKNKLIHIYFQVALGVKNSPDKAGDLRDVGSGLLGWSRV